MSNLPLRLASLALASLLWFAIAAEKTSEMGVTIPIELQNLPPRLELTGDAVNAVEVRLRASPGVIQRLRPGEITAQVDLSGVGEGERIVHLTEQAIRVPFGVQVVKINPSILTLHFERTQEKQVPVRPRLIGRPAAGFEVAEILSEPAEVRVIGPRGRVVETESAFTEPVSVEGARVDVVEQVSIGLDDPVLRLQAGSRVRVTARIREELTRRLIEDVPVEVVGGRASASPRTVSVEVEGPASAVAQLRPGDLRATADPAAARAGRAPVAVALGSGLAGVSVRRTQPEAVALRAARARR